MLTKLGTKKKELEGAIQRTKTVQSGQPPESSGSPMAVLLGEVQKAAVAFGTKQARDEVSLWEAVKDGQAYHHEQLSMGRGGWEYMSKLPVLIEAGKKALGQRRESLCVSV